MVINKTNPHIEGLLFGEGVRDIATGKFKRLSDFDYIERVKNKFGKTFDTDLIKFIGNNVEVVCEEHGKFNKNKHDFLRSKGCPVCSRKKTTLDIWVKESTITHNGRFDYSFVTDVTGGKKVKIICPQHGAFYQNAIRHKSGANGCKSCSISETALKRRKTLGNLISEFEIVHNHLYDYSDVIFTTVKDKVKINCTIHGTFLQTPDNHLQGQGCQKCGYGSPYKRSDYILKCRKTNYRSNFYIILCRDGCESFYKVGITNTTLAKRYGKSYSIPYEYRSIVFIESDAGVVWDLEKVVLNKRGNFEMLPNKCFAGMGECLVDDNTALLGIFEDILSDKTVSEEIVDVARKAKIELLKHFPCLEDVI